MKRDLRGGILLALGVSVAIAVVFQVLLRYQYIHLVGARIERVDRLTGATCEVPCAPPPTPLPTLSDEDYDAAAGALLADYARKQDLDDERAVEIAKGSQYAPAIAAQQPTWRWLVEGVHLGPSPPTTDPLTHRPVMSNPSPESRERVICYCDTKRFGYRWEVHVDTGQAFFMNDNTTLMRKHGLKP